MGNSGWEGKKGALHVRVDGDFELWAARLNVGPIGQALANSERVEITPLPFLDSEVAGS